MQSIGQQLKAERQRRKMTIADVVAATKMPTTVIEAIEADNFRSLAAPVYARGFIKLYAECLALDPLALLKQFGDLSARAPATLAALAQASLLKVPVAAAEKAESAPESATEAAKEAAEGATKVAAPACNAMPARIATRSVEGGRSIAAPLAPLAERLAGRKRIDRAALRQAAAAAHLVKRLIVALASLWARLRPKLKLTLFTSSARPWPKLNWKLFSSSARSWLRIPPAANWRVLFPVGLERLFLNLAAVILLVIAAGLIWGLCRRGQPTLTNECRWAAEPPAPYLDLEAPPVIPGR